MKTFEKRHTGLLLIPQRSLRKGRKQEAQFGKRPGKSLKKGILSSLKKGKQYM